MSNQSQIANNTNTSRGTKWLELLSAKKSLLLRVVFFLFASWFLCIYNQDVLYQIGWKNYFIFNDSFKELTVHQTSGWLIYVSLFINQIFFAPVIAGLVIAGLLTSIAILLEKCFLTDSKWKPIAYIPSALLLLIIGCAGFAIYAQFQMATFFLLIIGTLWAVIIYALYKRKSDNKPLMWGLLGLNYLLLPQLALFSLVSMGMIAIDQLLKKNWVPLVVSLLLYFPTLYIYSHYVFVENYTHSLCMPFPMPYFTDMFIYSVILALCLVAMPLLAKASWSDKKWMNNVLVEYGIMLVCLCFVFFMSYRDANYRTLMKLSRLTDKMEWKKVSEIASEVDSPTKGINTYRLIAELAQGKFYQKVFDVRLPFSPSDSPYRMESSVYAVDEYFYASFFAVSHQFNMDAWVEFTESYRGLKNMAMIALMRNEIDLAKRYIRLMKQAPVLRSIAEEYETYANDRSKLFKKYPFYEELVKYEPKQNIPQIVSNHIAAYYLWFSSLDVENTERRLLALLYMHKIDQALDEYMFLRKKGWHRPAQSWLQEALIIKSIISKNPALLNGSGVDPLLVNRVNACFKDFSSYRTDEMSKACKEMYAKYKGMYAYYFLFNNYKFDVIIPND